MTLQRKTKVVQELRIEIDLGPLPESKKLETVRVRRKTDGSIMRVNKKDFKEGASFAPKEFILLEEIDPDEGIDLAPEPGRRTETSLYNEDELATMPIKLLRQLPEFTRVTPAKQKTLRTKGDYVKALVSLRSAESKDPPSRASL